MELRGNIIFSIVLHATIFTAALALAGRELAVRSPERFIAVSLFEDHTEEKPSAEGTTARKKPSAEIQPPVSSPRKLPPPGAASPTAAMPAANPRGVESLPADRPAAEITTTDSPSPSGGSREISHGQMQTAIIATPALPAGRQGGTGDVAKGILPHVDAIRAAIEKAKRYPPLARERGFEGTVTAEFTISAEGYPENIRILHSSGYEILDAAAKKTLLRASPFPFVTGKLEVPITFRITR